MMDHKKRRMPEDTRINEICRLEITRAYDVERTNGRNRERIIFSVPNTSACSKELHNLVVRRCVSYLLAIFQQPVLFIPCGTPNF